MYEIQEKPHKSARLDNNVTVKPIVTLKDEYGGISHIIMDDSCYVLINGDERQIFRMVKHWHQEAARALSQIVSIEVS